MARNFKSKLLPLFLLVAVSVVCLHGNALTGDRGLQCVTDYLLVNCSLNLHTPSENTSYWLHMFETLVDGKTFLCNLTDNSGVSSCSTRKSAEDDSDILMDMYSFEISLCHKQHGEPETCEVLDDNFQPVNNIKPNAPCCLTMTRYSNRSHHFTWRSTYEQYSDYTNLVFSFMYQFYFYKKGDGVMSPNLINTYSTEYLVNEQVFVPDSEYAARVRSSPNQAYYQGQWSDWSSEVHWKTPAMDDSTHTTASSLAQRAVILLCLLCVLVPLVLLACLAPVKRWKQSIFIPNPAPYFNTLYSNYQGDFRSWVVTQGHTADMLKAEETLQIDTLIRSADVQEEDHQAQCPHQLMEGSGYGNITDQMCDEFLLGFPYIVSSTAPLSEPESCLKNANVSVQSGNAAEGDSGCWLCSSTSLEKDPPWYCNDYCTLSSFQELTLVTAEHIGSLCTQGIIREAGMLSE